MCEFSQIVFQKRVGNSGHRAERTFRRGQWDGPGRHAPSNQAPSRIISIAQWSNFIRTPPNRLGSHDIIFQLAAYPARIDRRHDGPAAPDKQLSSLIKPAQKKLLFQILNSFLAKRPECKHRQPSFFCPYWPDHLRVFPHDSTQLAATPSRSCGSVLSAVRTYQLSTQRSVLSAVSAVAFWEIQSARR